MTTTKPRERLTTTRLREQPMVLEEHEAFRNELASVQKDGRRKWVYARQPSGRFYRRRTVLSWFLLAFLFSAPFIKVAGQPLVLLNFLERRFVLLGLTFSPQDFYLVVLLALTILLTLALSTASVGRVWCGWLCPQTVFMEMLFRKIEYAIDGSAEQQLRRDRGPFTAARVARLSIKQAIFFMLSFVIANVFLAYFIGADALVAIITAPPGEHWRGLIAISIFSLVFYGVFARFREQACVLACPYGRVMSALIDASTVTVTYDRLRGEPRGRQRGEPRGSLLATDYASSGDCIDCGQCVTVCPTGIDIRNGIQLECVNCAACIDACDDVMQKVHRPAGLIRLTSHEAIQTGRAVWMTPRVKAYAAVWLVVAATTGTLIARRADVSVLLLRQPGTLFAEVDNGIGNFYNLQVINRTNRTLALEYVAVAPAGATITALGDIDEIAAHGVIESRIMVRIPRAALAGASTPIRVEIRADGKLISVVTTALLGPAERREP